MNPEFLLYKAFLKPAKKLLKEAGIQALRAELTANPEAGEIIKGGNGLRKHRVAIPGRGGKSGGARLIYYYYVAGPAIHLFMLYPKNEMENITDAQVRDYAKIIAQINNPKLK